MSGKMFSATLIIIWRTKVSARYRRRSVIVGGSLQVGRFVVRANCVGLESNADGSTVISTSRGGAAQRCSCNLTALCK